MARRPSSDAIDWDAIERQYRLGNKSNKQLAHEFGVDLSSISKRAKAKGWVVDKSDEVAAVTNSLLIQSASGNSDPNSTPSALEIKAAAQTNADVVLSHRTGLARLKSIQQKLVAQTEALVDNADVIHELVRLARDPDENGQDKANDRLKQMLGRSQTIEDFKKLVETEERIRKGEREAFGIDSEKSGGGWEDHLERLGRLNG